MKTIYIRPLDVSELHYTTITPELLLDRTALSLLCLLTAIACLQCFRVFACLRDIPSEQTANKHKSVTLLHLGPV